MQKDIRVVLEQARAVVQLLERIAEYHELLALERLAAADIKTAPQAVSIEEDMART